MCVNLYCMIIPICKKTAIKSYSIRHLFLFRHIRVFMEPQYYRHLDITDANEVFHINSWAFKELYIKIQFQQFSIVYLLQI